MYVIKFDLLFKDIYNNKNKMGRIEIILGCMFSGKSTELLRSISRYDAINNSILLINSTKDTRTGKSIKTHNNDVKTALKLDNLMELFNKDNLESYNNAKVIGIDESQFFPDLLKFIEQSERDDKIIIIAGLDGDSNRKPFGQILSCIPLCDTIVKLKAMDMISKDGTPAIFTKRIDNSSEQIYIGAKNKYLAVSRKNYLS